ncbi:2-octaprenyl-6-methoxyphenol hydroxylase [Legionella antarctica]|uniref:2-octaprenyl-6-methoxyphenol hydroxylase n=1 Tax=Legionella antarctica TaxID=2708020 RepID=A0A6F8T0X6_9GAMM|nr:2-octaprenyl-6-methoxyphenyl hydroxylase [Legionella antarctica]BCA93827.1 2-octaprenyl-6-methoxyphenol hydroxylase [Legionella antarctica]
MAKQQVDILIIGGGLTGATLMLALQGLGFKTLLVEAKPFGDKVNPDFDARSLALSPATKRILNTLGVWDILKEYATAIDMIHVSDQHRFGISRLHGGADNPLGYVVEMQHINLALHQLLSKDHIMAPATLTALDLVAKTATVSHETGEIQITAQLIVAADGAESVVRRCCDLSAKIKSYNQQAIVANVGLMKSHEHHAYERFTSHGPLALLPMNSNRMSLVWAMTPGKAEQLMALSDVAFLKELQQDFGYRLGRLIKIGKRYSYPLKQVLMAQQTKWPVVFVGNAAHTLHPVAGQGFNLGLRDAATLAQCISKQGLNEGMLRQYLQLRRHDQQVITRFTDGLIQVFTSRLPGMSLVRNMGLIAIDNIPVLKNYLARYARGFGGFTPDLVCEIALDTIKSPEIE